MKAMKEYYMSTGLWRVDPAEFENDKDAWNELRKSIPGKFAVLFRKELFNVPVVEEAVFVEKWNASFGPKPYGHGPDDTPVKRVGMQNTHTAWIPVLEGLTDCRAE